MQLDRRCGGGLQAVVTAAMMVQTGAADVVLAGGVESMSNIEYYTTDMRWGARAGTREAARPARARPRALAARGAVRPHLRHDRDRREPGARLRHHARGGRRLRGCAATSVPPRPGREGTFADEVVPVDVPQKQGRAAALRPRRRHARRHHARVRWRSCKPLMQDGTVTAGNASQQNDAAAACLVVAEDRARRSSAWSRSAFSSAGPRPAAIRRAWASARCRRCAKLFAAHRPVASTQMDLVELNEAFACQVLAVLAGLGLERSRSGSTSTARASRSATRSAPPACASWPRCCTN